MSSETKKIEVIQTYFLIEKEKRRKIKNMKGPVQNILFIWNILVTLYYEYFHLKATLLKSD